MNTYLEQAIQEAMLELDRQSSDIYEQPSATSTNKISTSSSTFGVVSSTQTIN